MQTITLFWRGIGEMATDNLPRMFGCSCLTGFGDKLSQGSSKKITSQSNWINYQKTPQFCNNQGDFGEFTVSTCHCFQVFSVIFMGPCRLKLDFIKNDVLQDFFHHHQYQLLALSKPIGTPTQKTEGWNLQETPKLLHCQETLSGLWISCETLGWRFR